MERGFAMSMLSTVWSYVRGKDAEMSAVVRCGTWVCVSLVVLSRDQISVPSDVALLDLVVTLDHA